MAKFMHGAATSALNRIATEQRFLWQIEDADGDLDVETITAVQLEGRLVVLVLCYRTSGFDFFVPSDDTNQIAVAEREIRTRLDVLHAEAAR